MKQEAEEISVWPVESSQSEIASLQDKLRFSNNSSKKQDRHDSCADGKISWKHVNDQTEQENKV